MSALVNAVLETTVTTGTGAVLLGGAVTGYRTFGAALSSGDRVCYGITETTLDANGAVTGIAREIGIGTYQDTGGVTSLARVAVLTLVGGSQSGGKLDLQPGTTKLAAAVAAAEVIGRGVTRAAADWAATAADDGETVVNAGAGAIAVTLPDTDTIWPGWRLTAKLTGTGTITVSPHSATERIDGDARRVIAERYASETYTWDGTAWLRTGSGDRGGRLLDVEYFTTAGSHTWNRPDGCHTARLLMVGGGAGGAWGRITGTDRRGGAGGNSGGLLEAWIDVTAFESAAVDVGAGGAAAQTTPKNVAPADGSATTFTAGAGSTLALSAGGGDATTTSDSILASSTVPTFSGTDHAAVKAVATNTGTLGGGGRWGRSSRLYVGRATPASVLGVWGAGGIGGIFKEINDAATLTAPGAGKPGIVRVESYS